MTHRHADTLLIGRVVTLDPACPTAEAIAVAGDTILAVGRLDDLRALRGPCTEIVEAAADALIVPAFHDAHLHLLKMARAAAKLDCGAISSIIDLASALRQESSTLPPGAWLLAHNLDEKRFPDAWLPRRADLDWAVLDRPVRLEHRSLHLDILNTEGLRRLGPLPMGVSSIERDADGEPTGRIYNGADLLRARLPMPDRQQLAADVWRASERLLSWGVTTVQDASITNDLERWELFHDLAESGHLGVRLVMLPGIASVPTLRQARPATDPVRLGPAKIMLAERTLDLASVVEQITVARRDGLAVAIHAITEAELAVALAALREATPNPSHAPDRIEHAATIPDDWLGELHEAGVTVVGQPGLVYDRGDHYLRDHDPELHGWLHRARTLLDAGVPYAVGSDAPVTVPSPGLALHALRHRRTRDGALLGPAETLDAHQALHTMTLAPAQAAGIEGLGVLRPGAWADIVVVDAGFLEGESPAPAVTALTMRAGQIVWRGDPA